MLMLLRVKRETLDDTATDDGRAGHIGVRDAGIRGIGKRLVLLGLVRKRGIDVILAQLLNESNSLRRTRKKRSDEA